MGNGYTEDRANVYFEARKTASVYNGALRSREGAAEMLGVSVSTLADYELGNTKVVPVDKVVLMADLYNCPQLKTGYCKHECPIGRGKAIATQVPTIEAAALRLVRDLDGGKLEKLKADLVEIAADGKVSEGEREKMRGVVRELDQLAYTISELKLFSERELRTEAGQDGA